MSAPTREALRERIEAFRHESQSDDMSDNERIVRGGMLLEEARTALAPSPEDVALIADLRREADSWDVAFRFVDENGRSASATRAMRDAAAALERAYGLTPEEGER